MPDPFYTCVGRPHDCALPRMWAPEVDEKIWKLVLRTLDQGGAFKEAALLGHREAVVYPWPCDDATALVLLATLNRLEVEDVPAKRAELLAELDALMSHDELALLLPEDGAAIDQSLALLELDTDALYEELEQAAERAAAESPRLISFAVLPEDEAMVEEAVARAAEDLEGRNRRGRALALICRAHLEQRDA